MTPNLTSAAAEEMRKGGIDHLMGRPVRVAIGERSRMMEAVLPQALHKLRLYRAQHSGEYIGGTEFSQLVKEIEQALAYDPLSPSH